MSQGTLNQALTSQSLNTNSGAQRPMVTGEQVMQFLSKTVDQGGCNGVMAQDVLALVAHTPAVSVDINQQLAPVVQIIAPREGVVARALDNVCVQYKSHIEQLPNSTGRQSAGRELAHILQTLPAAKTPEGQQLLRNLQQGRVSTDSATRHQLSTLLRQAQQQNDAARLPSLLNQLAKSDPDTKKLLQKAMPKQEEHISDKEKAVVSSEAKKNSALLTPDQEQAFDVNATLVQQRDGQQQGGSGSQSQADNTEDDELNVSQSGAVKGSRVSADGNDATILAEIQDDTVDVATRLDRGARLAINLVYPAGSATVNDAQAQQAARHVLQNNQVSLSGLVRAPLDSLLLQAATLGLKTFSNTADSVAKSIKINGDAQARLVDKKISDYQDQLAKAREQEHKSKKAKFWSAVFKPITSVLKFVFKPVMNLLHKIPGVDQALNWMQKNISEIALPLAIITSLLCPMSLPMTLGLLAVTSATAGFSIAGKIMGDKAPAWLKMTDQIGDMVSGMAIMVCTMSMMGGALSNIGGNVMRLFGTNTQQALKGMMVWGQRLDTLAGAGDSAAQTTLGVQQANLQKQIGEIDATLSLDEMQMDWLQQAREFSVDNMKNIFGRAEKVADSASKIISDTGSLRARIAGSLV